ncbi:hypothetical protein Gasu2_48910 [Galdieria sulphuraria]|uniref:Uncharacterized protein n=1 Tax=Galdieria sulphuraria TaxID=130081 RepID=M2XF74_GALSU|nr:uncharacterized protein Gasu_38600 [Galdieria sulphuraria]EME28652.1 hypothetical protein Gasu_38600 [Galdieria sulphuraria]GJD10715.1 hypothetical protein Gasu2_48910 [Galdieria sulphuraria]|eukprot:XP_005705172.1 hypothetical protein Gasu_38600 [Galdieria sulphuraria]
MSDEPKLSERSLHKFENVRIIIKDENKTCFQGELNIGEDWFCLLSEIDPSNSLRVNAKDLLLHAICQRDEHCEKPSIYCQVQGESDEDQYETIYIVPEESSQVEKIFETFCDLVRRTPVPLTDEEGSDGEWYGNVPWSVGNCDSEQFEDAEETDTQL